MRVLVCGGRDFDDKAVVWAELNAIHEEQDRITHLFHGNARGADTLASEWGRSAPGVIVCACPANWKKYGKRAGPIRNQHMLGQSPDLVLAFPGGRGTADMVRRAKEAGVKVVEIDRALAPFTGGRAEKGSEG
jgi:hypothetical protein